LWNDNACFYLPEWQVVEDVVPDLGSRPYVERQLIVVSQKEILRAAQEENRRKSQAEKEDGPDWRKIGTLWGTSVFGITPMLIAAGIEAYQAWSRARDSGVPILPICLEQAATLSFPPGHPREGVLYVGHPAIPNVYYTMANFHRYMFEHKLCEAVELLMSLGATTIRVEHVSGWSRDFSSRLSVPLASPDDTASAQLNHTFGVAKSILFEASLSGTNVPSVPNSLVWYPHEPTWANIARGRLKHGLRDFSISVSYLDDFGINAGLKATVVKAGLELGGKFEGHESTVWRLEGKFAPEGTLGHSDQIIGVTEKCVRDPA
jgi:hypothetical protein